ncbi:T9SS type A sorting domain-containing protein [Ekhidna sp.]|uniref:T9SS type A sorting domain-containing protein n=1 Tax=Ekhidna sp. TaxID=2608089 RepID=UPI003517DBC0
MKNLHKIILQSFLLFGMASVNAQIELVSDINSSSEVKDLRIVTDIAIAGDKPIFFYEAHPEYGDEPWTLNGSNEVVLIKDILPGAQSVEPNNPIQFGDKVIFSVQYLNRGYLPTITDGTEAGTFSLADFDSGTDAYSFVRLNETEFMFQVRKSDDSPIQLWKTDGTVNGTLQMVTLPEDVNYINSLTFALNKIFFRASTESLGTELWVTDGTESGTKLVKDIYEGTSSGDPSKFTEANGYLYFRARTATEGYELWKSDGTVEGTSLVKEIRTGTADGLPSNTALGEFDGKLYFAADDGIVGNELWISDGTEEGTILFKDLREAGYGSPNNFFAFDDMLLFRAYGSEGEELWKTDGTAEGTEQILDINTGSGSSYANHFTLFNNKVYFSAKGATEDGLWVTDGTSEGTEQVAAIDFGSSSSFRSIAASSTSLFIATEQDGPQLFVSDGTTEGTIGLSNEVTIFNSSEPRDFFAFSNGMIFTATRDNGETSLWYESSGTVVDLLPEGVVAKSSLNGWYFQEAINGQYFFVADTEEEGEELWTTDGTPEGTQMIKDIRPGSSSSGIESVALFGNKIIFQARTAEEGREPWISDGTTEGTVLLKDVNPGTGESNPRHFTVINNKCYFSASDGSTGREIWMTDGTESGTEQLVDLNPSADGVLQFKFVFNDQLIIEGSEDASTYGYEVVISDLTAEGTQRITDINEGSGFTNIRDYAIFDSYFVFFTYISEDQSYELWKSNGTAEGTILLQDGIKRYVLQGSVGESVVYFAKDENDLVHLQATDGSGTTVMLVEDIPIRIGGEDDLNDKNAVLADGKLFITAGIFEDGNEYFSAGSALWVTDGTVGGTVEISVDAYGNPVAPLKVFVHDDEVYFNGYNTETNGYTLWHTDGTTCGTQSLNDDPVSILGELAPINGYLYFRGYTPDLGSELYRYNLSSDIPSLLVTWYRDADGDGLGDINDFVEDCSQPAGYVSNADDCVDDDAEISQITWYRDGDGDGLGDENQTIEACEAPVGYVDNSTDCDDTDDSNQCALGVGDHLVKIYPNPASDYIHVDSKDAKSIRLIDLNGRTILYNSGEQSKIDIQNLRPGTYLLKVAGDKSQSTHKIIKAN